MDDLISRKAAIDATWEEPSYTDPLNVLTEVRDRIEALPTIDTAKELFGTINVYMDTDEVIGRVKELGWGPVEHGRWIREWDMRGNISDVVWSCSVCGKPKQWCTTNYCPHCGARMDEEVDHDDHL